MSDGFDSDDPFAEFTAEDFDTIEHEAIAATQSFPRPPSRAPYKPPIPAQRHLQPPLQIAQNQVQLPRRESFTRATSFGNPFPVEEPAAEDDYNQFNVDDEDLVLIDTDDIPLHSQSLPPPPPPHNTNQSDNALHEELAFLRRETARLKAERDKFQTMAYSNDGKMDHLQRTLSKVKLEHESAVQRLQKTSETEKRTLLNEVAERERKLAALTADIEFQRNELREAMEMASRGGSVTRPAPTTNGDMLVSPKKTARVVKGSGVKSPESKNRIGLFSARAFGRDESVLPATKTKKRKREEPIITPEPVVVESGIMSESEINKIVMERVLRERSTWTVSDERFEVYPCWKGG